MKLVGCVIGRMGSTRLPGKVLMDLDGEPMLDLLVRRMGRSQRLDELVLCTTVLPSDDVLAAHGAALGLPVVRGPELEVIDRLLKAAREHDATHIARITADNPWTDPTMLDAIAASLHDGGDYGRVERVPIGVTPEVVSLDALKDHRSRVDPKNSDMLFFLFAPDRYRCHVLLPPPDLEGYDRKITVDLPSDLQRARRLAAAIGHDPDYKALLGYLRTQPDCEMPPDAPVMLPSGPTTYASFRQSFVEQRIAQSTRGIFEPR